MTTIFNTAVWAQERNILTLSNFSSGTEYIELTVAGHSELTAKYVVPTSGTLEIDLSDLVRMYVSGSFTVTEVGPSSPASNTTGWNRSGLIKPESVLIPETEQTNTALKLLIMPPSVMLKQIGTGSGAQTLFEMYGSDDYQFATGRVKMLPSENTLNFARQIAIETAATAIELWHLADVSHAHINLQELQCGHVYAAVEWTSFSGITRRHTFEVVKQTSEPINEVKIETINNEYDERKGRRDGFTLKLEGLSRYDMWYYGDILTSSKVRVSFNGTTWRQVQVTGKAIELPMSDEGALNVLEIPVNYRHYDTL